MTESRLPEGARSNGLFAENWVAVAATAPPIADNILVALREVGIAAYSLPNVEDSVYRGLSLESPLTQRIWVDADKREVATMIVAKEQAEVTESKKKSEFDEIVSQLSMPSASTYLDVLDQLDHYEPEPPGPLPKFSRATRISLIGVIGGPLLLVLTATTNLDPTGFGTWLGLGGFVAGLVGLLMRTKDDNDEEPPDGGAVV